MPRKSARGESSSWKTVQSKIKIKRKTKLALLVLGSVVVLILIGQAFKLFQTILSPWGGQRIEKNYRWDSKFNLNLLIVGDISVLSYNPTEKSVTVIKIPKETYIEVPKDLGKWQVRSIQGVGGTWLLKDSIASFLGIPLDGFIEFKGDLISQIRQKPLGIFNHLSSVSTDLTPWELLKLQFSLSSVRFDKIHALDLANILDSNQLADGTKIFTADPAQLDAYLTFLTDAKLMQEHQSIAIFNATSFPQLAQKAARMITNLGGNVIIVSNAQKKVSKSYVWGKPSQTFDRLTQIFGFGCVELISCDKLNLEDLGIESSRAQINIILGEDFYSKFGNK